MVYVFLIGEKHETLDGVFLFMVGFGMFLCLLFQVM